MYQLTDSIHFMIPTGNTVICHNIVYWRFRAFDRFENAIHKPQTQTFQICRGHDILFEPIVGFIIRFLQKQSKLGIHPRAQIS